jgi:hypothetical protein
VPIHPTDKKLTLDEAAERALDVFERHLATLEPSARQKAVERFNSPQKPNPRGIRARLLPSRRTSAKSR